MASCAKAPVAVFSHESLPVKSLHAPHERNAYTFVAGSTAVVFRLLRRLEQNGDIHKVPRMSSCRRLLSLCFKPLGRLQHWRCTNYVPSWWPNERILSRFHPRSPKRLPITRCRISTNSTVMLSPRKAKGFDKSMRKQRANFALPAFRCNVYLSAPMQGYPRCDGDLEDGGAHCNAYRAEAGTTRHRAVASEPQL